MPLTDELTGILDQYKSPEELRQAILAPFREALHPPKAVYLFGAARLGEKFLTFCRQAGYGVKAFLDSSPQVWGTAIHGIPVQPPEAADRNLPVIITSGYLFSIRDRLRDLGFRLAVPFPILFLLSDHFLPELGYEGILEELFRHRRELIEAVRYYPEERSQQVLRQIVLFRTSFDPDHLRSVCESENNSEQYFRHSFFRLPPRPALVDGGAYTGDSTADFVEACGGDFHQALLFEPDPELLQKARNRLSRLENVRFFPYGLYSRSAVLRFSSTQALDGRISEAGDAAIEVRPIDSMVDSSIDIIKLDIEGAEEEALHGAARTIRQSRPLLMVSAYHRPCDLWKLPRVIRDIHPDYDFFLRHFSQSNVATVLFAIPQENRTAASRRSP